MATAKERAGSAADLQMPNIQLLDSAQRQLDALRGAIDARLAELDTALEDPARASSLAPLVAELSRLATTEAQAAANRACLQITIDGEAALLEADARSSAAVESERRRSTDLRKSLENAETHARRLETEKQDALQAAQRQSQLAEAERAARADAERTNARLERELAAVHNELQGAQDHARTLSHECAEARNHAVTLEQRLTELAQRLAAEEMSARALSSERDSANARIPDLERQIHETQQRLAETQQLLAAERVASKGFADERVRTGDRIAELELELESLQQQFAAAQDAVVTGEDQVAEAHTRITALEGQLAARGAERDETQRRLEHSTRELATAAGELTDARRVLGDAMRKLADQTLALADATRQLDAERAVAAELRAAISAAHEHGDGDQEAIALLRQAAADAQLRAEELREAHASVQTSHDGVLHELNLERQRVADTQRAHAALQAAHARLSDQLEAERRAAADLRGTVTGSNDERGALARELERVTAAKSALEASLEELREQAARDVAADQLLQDSLRQAQAEVQAARADLAALQQRLAAVESGRAEAEETAAEFESRAAAVERERDALSLALDTERMMSADLRDAIANAERRLREAMDERDSLVLQRQQSADGGSVAPLPEDGAETELTFDEDAEQDTGGTVTLDEEGWESVRLSTRYTFPSRIDITIDGKPAVLTDLSVGGCGTHTATMLETGQTVEVHLPGELVPLQCLGVVVWVQKESHPGTAALCEAGIQFTQADESALEAFIIMHADL